MDRGPPGSTVHGTSQARYWSGLPFPSPGGLPDPGIKPTSPLSPAVVRGFFTTEPSGEPPNVYTLQLIFFLEYWYHCMLEKEMAIASSIIVWRIPWTEEPDGLQFMGSQKRQT